MSKSSSNECFFTFLTTTDIPFSSVIPRTSLNVTRWPSCNSTRSSSMHVTSAGESFETLATMHDSASSPSTSTTLNASPKSQNTFPNTPRTSVLINATLFARHMALIATASASDVSPAHTTTECALTASSSQVSTQFTSTAGFSSCNFPTLARARVTFAFTLASST